MARAGCYAPGGRARYPSTVLMCAVPARVAGVEEIVLCVPPGARRPGRRRHAGRGRDRRCRRGLPGGWGPGHRGHGLRHRVDRSRSTSSSGRATATWPRPSARCPAWSGVPSAFAGPSEVVVIAGPETPAELAAIDLVVQAEHGPDGLAWLVTWSEAVADAVDAEVDRLVAEPRRAEPTWRRPCTTGGYVVLVDGPDQACAVANVVAPEHLEILIDDADTLLPLVDSAGAVFLGPMLAGQRRRLPGRPQPRAARPTGARGSPARSGSTTSVRHIHAVSVDEKALEALGPPRGDPGRDRGAARARRVGARAMAPIARARAERAAAFPGPARPRRRSPGTTRPGRGRRAAQHQRVAAAAAAEWFERFRDGMAEIEFNRYPDRDADRAPPGAGRSATVCGPSRYSAPTARTRCCSPCCSPTAGPGRTAALFEPTYTLHRHIARSPAPRWCRAAATRIIRARPRRGDAGGRRLRTR